MYGINMFQITALVKLTIVGLWIITTIQNNNYYLLVSAVCPAMYVISFNPPN